MFPTVTYDVQVQQLTQVPADTSILANFVFDYTQMKFVVIDGKPLMNSGIQAIEQWIVLFLNTSLGAYGVYVNSKFGTNILKLIGYKKLNNGYVESEVQREITEGFVLCPDIQKITSFNLTKDGRTLVISLSVLTYSGVNLGVNINVNAAIQ